MTKLRHHGDLPPEIRHRIHGHSLRLVSGDDGVEFQCDGCKLDGADARYECGRGAAACECDLDLHISCALAPARREIGGREFVLLDKPPAGCGCGSGRHCDACGGTASGFLYHCASLDYDVHPCCAHLPEAFDLAGLSFELRMGMGMGKHDAPPSRCALCDDKTKGKGRRRRSWFYRSVGSEAAVFLHVACARDLAAACASFTNVSSLGEKATETESVIIKAPGDGGSHHVEMVPVKASALRALLLGRGNNTRGGALKRCLSVLCFIVRIVIGVIFGDPAAMIVAVFSGV